MPRVMDGSPVTAGKRCRGYGENAGGLTFAADTAAATDFRIRV